MNLIKLRQKSQLTIPKKVREKLGVEPGDYFDVDTKDKKIILTPKVSSSESKSELSKKGEKELDESLEQLKKGEVEVYESVDEMINSLSDN